MTRRILGKMVQNVFWQHLIGIDRMRLFRHLNSILQTLSAHYWTSTGLVLTQFQSDIKSIVWEFIKVTR